MPVGASCCDFDCAVQTVLGESQHDTLQPCESLSTALQTVLRLLRLCLLELSVEMQPLRLCRVSLPVTPCTHTSAFGPAPSQTVLSSFTYWQSHPATACQTFICSFHTVLVKS